MHDAALAEVNFRKLTLGIGEFELDRLRRLGPAASDLGKPVFEAVHHIDANPVCRSRHWIEDRLTAAFGYALHNQSGFPLRNINLKLDRSEDRIVQLFERRGISID